MTILGRDTEIGAVAESVGASPLITLVGVGGVGKTTIAKAVGAKLSDSFPAGAWFVDLTATDDPDQLAATVASALNIGQRPGMSPKESLFDALRNEPRLVILDNAEQQIDAVADLVDETLVAVSDIKLIVTSREPLSLRGEDVHRIGPLRVTGDGGAGPAVDLFIERAKAVAPDLSDEAFEAETVAAICAKLDGLPLAIELAAAQSETMTPVEILTALEGDGLDLQSSSRSTVQRHRSLDDLVGWSYELLDPIDRIVFERLSAFTGGCTIEAATAVCSGGEVSEANVRSSVTTLVRKSIVQTERTGGSTRLTMLETLRSFSLSRLRGRPDSTDTAERHAIWFGEFSAHVKRGVSGPTEAKVLAAMLADLDNIQSATRWASEHGRFDIMNDLGSSLTFLLESKIRPGLSEWISEMAATVPPDNPARLPFAYAITAAMLFQGRFTDGPETFAAETAGLENSPQIEALKRYAAHVSGFFGGDLEFVIADGQGAMEELFDLGLVREACGIGTDYALSLFYSGDVEEAARVADRIGQIAEETANPTLLAWSMYVHGEISGESDPASAIEMLEEAVESGITVDNEFVAGISLIALSSIAGRNGDMDTAFDGMYRAVRLWRARGNRPQMWTAVRNLVEILHTVGHDRDALTLNAAVEADAERAPELFGPFGDHYRSILADVEEALDPAEAAEARRVGGALDYPGAANFALAAIGRATA
jgi:predicted ATPase